MRQTVLEVQPKRAESPLNLPWEQQASLDSTPDLLALATRMHQRVERCWGDEKCCKCGLFPVHQMRMSSYPIVLRMLVPFIGGGIEFMEPGALHCYFGEPYKCIGASLSITGRCHFVAFIKSDEEWLFYDDMDATAIPIAPYHVQLANANYKTLYYVRTFGPRTVCELHFSAGALNSLCAGAACRNGPIVACGLCQTVN